MDTRREATLQRQIEKVKRDLTALGDLRPGSLSTATELAQLQQYEDAELITVDAERIQVTAKGRMFVRAVGMVFDKYLAQPSTSKFSKLI